MNGRKKEPFVLGDAEILQSTPQFTHARIAKGDACHPTRFSHRLAQEPRDFDRDYLHLSAARSCKNDAVTIGFVGLPLLSIRAEFLRGLDINGGIHTSFAFM